MALLTLFLYPLPPGDPEGGFGLSCSFRSRGFGPDPGIGNLYFNFDFDLSTAGMSQDRFKYLHFSFYSDLKYSWDVL